MLDVSVIVVAYKRKDYILECVSSVRDQTLESNRYEIVVVKNFVDPDIDRILENDDVVVLNSTHKELGDKILEAFHYTTGRYVCFLEDDDLFHKSKLKWILETFEGNPELAYIHNQQKFIDSESNPIRQWYGNGNRPTLLLRKPVVKERILKRLMRNKQNGHNMSSWSIRRDEFEYLEISFKGIVYHLDAMVLLQAIASKRDALFSGETQTFFRVHKSTTSFSSSTGAHPEFGNNPLLTGSLNEYERFSRTFSQSPLFSYIENYKEYVRTRKMIIQGETIDMGHILPFVMDSLKHPNFRWVEYSVIFALLFLYSVRPNFGRALYMRLSYMGSKG